MTEARVVEGVDGVDAPQEDGARQRPLIPYEDVSKVDLSKLGVLDDDALRTHFEGIAALATVSQLRMFLDGQTFSGLGDETHAQLSDRYVRRRMGVVRDLLAGRDRMNRTLDALLGGEG